MSPASFLTRVESYQDPKALWPLAAIASVLAHGVMWLGLRPLMMTTQAPAEWVEPPIPIQLLAPGSDPQGPDQSGGDPPWTEGSPSPARATESPVPTPAPIPPRSDGLPRIVPPVPEFPSTAPEPVAPSPLSPPLPRPLPPEPIPPPQQPQVASPPAPVLPPPAPAVTEPPTDGSVAPSPPMVTAPPADWPPAAAEPESPAPHLDSGSGQLVPRGIQPAPYGRDLPDVPPRLVSNASISVQPWLSVCGVENLAAIASAGVKATVQLQLHVQPNGAISFVQVVQGTGNPALDQLIRCIVPQQVQLEPAMLAGEPYFTDAYLLDIQVLF
ncbi:MAG TPA: hypothetical protein IGR64_03535 [Leptolyngbyaceae cyanobacterium M65_K2018_010]|nr:hypothetical protein [Leptolyngbyaceae cyanobacterium M65_K2018_010]